MKNNDSYDRVALLTHVPRSSRSRFALQAVDGQPVSVSERIAAKVARDGPQGDAVALELLRLELTLEELMRERPLLQSQPSGMVHDCFLSLLT